MAQKLADFGKKKVPEKWPNWGLFWKYLISPVFRVFPNFLTPFVSLNCDHDLWPSNGFLRFDIESNDFAHNRNPRFSHPNEYWNFHSLSEVWALCVLLELLISIRDDDGSIFSQYGYEKSWPIIDLISQSTTLQKNDTQKIHQQFLYCCQSCGPFWSIMITIHKLVQCHEYSNFALLLFVYTLNGQIKQKFTLNILAKQAPKYFIFVIFQVRMAEIIL